jgi:hypothetical protein
MRELAYNIKGMLAGTGRREARRPRILIHTLRQPCEWSGIRLLTS